MSNIGLMKAARIKAIHKACRDRGIDAETRHALQLRLTGKASLTDMHLGEVSRVLDHLNGNGGDNEWRFVFGLADDRQACGRKIFRMAERIGPHLKPAVKVASKAYIEGITEQMRGATQPLEFCDADQLRKVVQALEIYCKRHGY